MGLTLVPQITLPPMAVRLASQSFSGVSSVSTVASTFTTSYHKYKIIMTADSGTGSGNIYARLRASGTDLTANYYNAAQTLPYSGAMTYANQRSNGSEWWVAGVPSNGTVAELTLINPAHTGLYKQGYGMFTNINGEYAGDILLNNTNTGVYNAITFYSSSGTMTGRYEVYGYTE